MLAKRKTRNVKQGRLGKELQRLKRQDLLELLVAQLKEGDRLQATIAEHEATIAELSDLSERLKGRLNDKDAKIEHLKRRLDQKDATIERLHERDHNLARMRGGIGTRELLDCVERAVEDRIRELALRAPDVEDPELDAIVREVDDEPAEAFGATAEVELDKPAVGDPAANKATEVDEQ